MYSIVTTLVRFESSCFMCPCITILTDVGDIGNIETAVSFLSNGTPHMWMSFLVIIIACNLNFQT